MRKWTLSDPPFSISPIHTTKQIMKAGFIWTNAWRSHTRMVPSNFHFHFLHCKEAKWTNGIVFGKGYGFLQPEIASMDLVLNEKSQKSLGLGYTETCGTIRCHLKHFWYLPLANRKKEGKSSNGRHETYFKWHLMAPYISV